MYDNIYVDDSIISISDKAKWLEKKTAFKQFIINSLKIEDRAVIDRLLDEFNEGLSANIDFRMLMFALGYNEAFIDEVINKYNAGEKPRFAKYDNFYESNNKELSEATKLISKKRFYYKRKPYDPSKLEQLKQKAKDYLDNLKLANLDIVFDNSLTQSIFDDKVTISTDAYIYQSITDLVSLQKPEIPYYDNNIPRDVIGVACFYNNEYIMIRDNFALDSILANGGTITGVLTAIDGNTEGFYKIDDIKRGVTR